MASLEHADELLEAGKRKQGLKELREVVAECRQRPAYHTPAELAGLLLHLAYELRIDRKTGMLYFGKYQEESRPLVDEAEAVLKSTDERADSAVWMKWHGVARRLALMDTRPFDAVEISRRHIERLTALGDVDPETIEQLRELQRRDQML